MRKIVFLLALVFWSSAALHAQKYKIQKGGYSADPKFHALIKSRGYSLVGLFETVSTDPLLLRAKVMKNGRWIFIDQNGEELPPEQRDNRYVSPSYAPGEEVTNPGSLIPVIDQEYDMFHRDGKFGIMNTKTGQEIVPARYESIRKSINSYFLVKLGGKWGVLSEQGQELIPPKYDESRQLGMRTRYTNGIVGKAEIVRSGEVWGLLSEDGKELIAPQYHQIKSFPSAVSVLAYSKDNKWGLLSKDGTEITKPIYNQIELFHRETFKVRQGKNPPKVGLIDSLGNEVLAPVYDDVTLFVNNLFWASTGHHPQATYLLYNRQGKQMLQQEFVRVDRLVGDLARVTMRTASGVQSGFIDSTGAIAIKPEYDYIDYFSDKGTSVVRQNGKTGLINRKGAFVVKPIYESYQHVYDDVNIVQLDSKYGVMDDAGKLTVPVKYDMLRSSRLSTVFTYKKGEKWGLTSTQGELTQPLYEAVFELESVGFGVYLDEKFGVLTPQGKLVVPLKYQRRFEVVEGGFLRSAIIPTRYLLDLYGNAIPQ
jgi:hypothetical protein